MRSSTNNNPMGTDGVEFVEYATADPGALGVLFETFGFTPVAKHRSRNVLVYRQGDINFIVNAEPDPVEEEELAGELGDPFVRASPFVCGMRRRRTNARARSARGKRRPMPARWSSISPACTGVGDSVIYLVDPLRRRLDLRRGFPPARGSGPKAARLGAAGGRLPRSPNPARPRPGVDQISTAICSASGRSTKDRGDGEPVRKDSSAVRRVREHGSRWSAAVRRRARRGNPTCRARHLGLDLRRSRRCVAAASISSRHREDEGSAGQRALTEPALGAVAFEIVERMRDA